MKVTINKDQKLYVMHSGNGYSCYGFEVLFNKALRLSEELGRDDLKPLTKGTMTTYNKYQKLVKIARIRHERTGFRSKSELIPEFIGKEGWRVEVVTSYGEKNRFIIGKSTGFIPCHLEIKKSNSMGGGAVCGYPFKSMRFIERVY